MKMTENSRSLHERICNILWPPSLYCIACGSVTDRTRRYSLCDDCMTKILWAEGPVCAICGKVLSADSEKETGICMDCQEFPHEFDRGITCTAYGLYERKIITDFKKRGKSWLARPLAEILHDRTVIENPDTDVIIPVPVHRKRLKQRGYNQAELLGRFLSEKTGWPMKKNVLVRTRSTAPMKQLDRWQRRENLRDAFAVTGGEEIRGKNLLLVDDIYTTGATADVCAALLKENGAEKVCLLTFSAGRTPSGGR